MPKGCKLDCKGSCPNCETVPDWRKDLVKRIEELVAIGYEREEAEDVAIAEYYGDDEE